MKYVLVFVCLLVLACGGQTQTGAMWAVEDAGSNQSFSAPDDTLTTTCSTNDAGTFVVDGGNGNGTNVTRQAPGSWILTTPKIHLVFWGDWWYSQAKGKSDMVSTIGTWSVLANDSAFYSLVNEYGVGIGQMIGTTVSYPNLPPGLIQESDIQTELNNEIQNNTLPKPDNQTIYVMVLPPNTQSQYNVAAGFGGHHQTVNNFTYAVIENHADWDNTISHEIYEAVTDPDLTNGWYALPGGETEIADLCGNTWQLDGHTIAGVWSQSQCKCIP